MNANLQILLCTLWLTLVCANPQPASMEVHKVVPEILDSVPPALAVVKYGPGVEMHNGAELTPGQVKAAPVEVTWPAETNTLYTVLMTDPDAPSRAQPLFREIAHWLVVNVPGNNLTNGETILDYIGSGPPEGSGLHRYILTVYKQSARLVKSTFDYLQGPAGRRKFNTRNFISKHALGQPIAGNFFQAQIDDYLRAQRAGQLKVALEGAKIVPDLIEKAPEGLLSLLYTNGVIPFGGNELTPTQVKDLPVTILWRTKPSTLYTLLMIDPDATHGEFLHWLVVNIPGTDLQKGETYIEYIGAGPPKDAGKHRYIFLVYEQSGALTLNRTKENNRSYKGRIGFKSRDFVKDNHLVGPVAGNFFLAQYDDYVLELAVQLGLIPNRTGTTEKPSVKG